jgi:hypothetical protein
VLDGVGPGSCRVLFGVPVPVLSYHGKDARRGCAESRVVSHPRAICALIGSGHRVSTRKTLERPSLIAFGASGWAFSGLRTEPVDRL